LQAALGHVTCSALPLLLPPPLLLLLLPPAPLLPPALLPPPLLPPPLLAVPLPLPLAALPLLLPLAAPFPPLLLPLVPLLDAVPDPELLADPLPGAVGELLLQATSTESHATRAHDPARNVISLTLQNSFTCGRLQ